MWNKLKQLLGMETSDGAESKTQVSKPRFSYLYAGSFFRVNMFGDPRLPDLAHPKIAEEHLIHAAGSVPMGDDGTVLLRFYTDNDAWLQLRQPFMGSMQVLDTILFHYFDTISFSSESAWWDYIENELREPTCVIMGRTFSALWIDEKSRAAPSKLFELCYDAQSDEPSKTESYAVLYQRELPCGKHELAYIAAECRQAESGPEYMVVISTGVHMDASNIEL